MSAHQVTAGRARPFGFVRWRVADWIRDVWPPGSAGKVLLALLVVGFLLRFFAVISLWPTTILQDGYETYAKTNPFLDPLHPAGYSLILAAIGAFTHQILATVLLQHLLGICAAFLLGSATRRITGSAWAGLAPAAIVLLGGDEIFLEHSIMAESWSLLAISIGLYAAVRAIDRPRLRSRWALLTGLMLAAAVAIRDADLPLIGVVMLALAVGPVRTGGRRRDRWLAVLAVGGAAALLLLSYAGASATSGSRFGIAPSPGWYLYGRVAQFADCGRFTPPPGTSPLCQSVPPAERPSGYAYMFVPQQSPAWRITRGFPTDDSLLRGWAERALFAQFGDFLITGWSYLRSYYVPSSLPVRLKGSTFLDPQLDFANGGNIFYVAAGLQSLQQFFGKFTTHRTRWGLDVLRDWQVVIRFGATALFVTTILVLVGLVIGTPRSRFGVILFGVGSLSLLLVPSLTSTYSGRYTVPMAGPLIAASAITITEIYRALVRWQQRRSQGVIVVP